jgi:ribonuclease HI
VISPSLFIIFINDILGGLPGGVEASLFADDLALIASDTDKEVACAKMQEALTAIERWSAHWGMTISHGKSEVTFFTTSSKPLETSYQPPLQLLGQPMVFNPAPVFLGVKFDRLLTFNDHVKTLAKKLKIRSNVIKAISGKDWGCPKEDLWLVYNSFILSAALYAAPAWMPSASDTTLGRLQTVQNGCARTITGACSTAPLGPLNWEARLMPIMEKRTEAVAKSFEKAMRKEPGHPNYQLATATRDDRLKRGNWAKAAKKANQESCLKDIPRERLLPVASFAPWIQPTNIRPIKYLNRPCKRSDDPALKKAIAEDTIRSLGVADVEAWCDGSADEAIRNGGSGILLVDNVSNTTHELTFPAGLLSSSYRAELVAMLEATKWMNANATPEWSHIHIFSDSNSLIDRLENGPTGAASDKEAELWRNLLDLAAPVNRVIVIQWVPGHADVAGNEAADKLAKAGSRMEQSNSTVDYQTASSAIKREAKARWQKSVRHDSHPLSGVPPPPGPDKEAGLSKKERATMSQLRAGGHCFLFAAYRHRIGKQPDPSCGRCGDPEEDMLHVLFDCPALTLLRLQSLGENPGIRDLWARPCQVIDLLRRCGALSAPHQH